LSIVFGTPTTLTPRRCSSVRDAEGVLAADRDQPVDPGGQVLADPLDPALLLQRVRARGAEDRPAAGQDAPHLGMPSGGCPLERPAPAVAVADELVPVDRDALAHDGADHRVQPGAVTAPRENADPHPSR
jgi:hypothetical protein